MAWDFTYCSRCEADMVADMSTPKLDRDVLGNKRGLMGWTCHECMADIDAKKARPKASR